MSAQPAKLIPLFVVAAACLSLTPVTAAAGIKCKSKAVSVGGLTEDEAVAAWQKEVRGTLGAAWSNWSLARGKSYSTLTLPVQNLNFVSAYPCRRD